MLPAHKIGNYGVRPDGVCGDAKGQAVGLVYQKESEFVADEVEIDERVSHIAGAAVHLREAGHGLESGHAQDLELQLDW